MMFLLEKFQTVSCYCETDELTSFYWLQMEKTVRNFDFIQCFNLV